MSDKSDRILRRVWSNERGKRYVPRGDGGGGHGWRVWDCREGRFVGDDKLATIDPDELFAN